VNQPAAEAFLDACGARVPPPLEVAHRGRGVVTRQLLPLPFALIGRNERADLRFDGKEVSHRHAYLQMVNGRWWWVDLDSRTGTHPEGTSTPSLPLLDRQGIRIGSYTIRLAAPSRPSSSPNGAGGRRANGAPRQEDGSAGLANPLEGESDDPSLLPRVALEFRGGTTGLQTWRMDRSLALIGRAPICKVRLHSPMVSRTHCALVNTPSGLWVVDLLGREGTYINGVSVRWGRLDPEDEMQIDQFRIRVRYLTAPAQANDAMPHLQPANEDHALEPRANGKGGSAGPLPPFPNFTWQREEGGENSPAQVLSSVGLAVPMNGSAESLLMPLLSQFSMMQQQMFDQFQHTLLMMAQMFGNLQREQMAMVRQELDQIQELTRELHALQAEGVRQAAPSSGPNSSAPVPSAKRAAPAPPPVDASKFCDPDVHTLLSQRLAAIQEERQTRWQKVLGLITGK